MELLEESGIAEIEVKEGEESIKLSRNISQSSIPNQPIYQQPVLPAQQPVAQNDNKEPSAQGTAGDSNKKTVNSPMVGTFYASASPE